MSNCHIISLVGSVGAGKSTLIAEFQEILKAQKINFYSFGIDPVRKSIWEEKGKGEWTWEDEDEAYGEILSQISLLINHETSNGGKTVIILETTGLARRMHRAHRLLSQLCNLSIVKVSCDAQTCLQRHETRDKDMREYPPLALQNTIEEGILLMAESLQTLPADMILDSNLHSAKENSGQLWNWLKTRLKNTQRKPNKKLPELLSPYVLERQKKAAQQTSKIPNSKAEILNCLLLHQPELLEICKLIAQQVSNQQANAKILVASSFIREALLGVQSKKIELEAFGIDNESLFAILTNCFNSKVRILNRRKISYLIFTSAGEEIRVNSAASDLFLGGQAYPSAELYAEDCDFTINGIFLDPLNNEIIDPLAALEDLKNLTLKSPNLSRYNKHPKTFIDIYRAIQLVGRFGFKLDGNLKVFFQKSISEGCLQRVSAFFTAEELNLLFNSPRFPSLALELMRGLGVLASDFPEILELYEQECSSKNKSWTNTLIQIDKACAQSLPVVLATFLSEIFKQNEKISVVKIEQILGIFQLGEKIVALAAICLIQRQKLFELKKLFDKKPAPTPKKIQPRALIGPRPVDDLRQPVADFFASLWPLTLEQFIAFLEICEDKQFQELKSFLDSLISRYKIDPELRTNLVSKKMLLERFKSIQGETISKLLSEIDKQRLHLITPESALEYIEQNLPRLINDIS